MGWKDKLKPLLTTRVRITFIAFVAAVLTAYGVDVSDTTLTTVVGIGFAVLGLLLGIEAKKSQ